MKTDNSSTQNLVWSYIAQGFNLFSGLALLPFIVFYLSAEEAMLWFVFLTLQGFVALCEFGFMPTISRNVSYALSGQAELLAVGISDKISESGNLDTELLRAVYDATRQIYLLISLASLLILTFLATPYVYFLLQQNSLANSYLLVWVPFMLGVVLNLYFGYAVGLLHGTNNIAAASKAIIYGRICFLFMSMTGILLGYGLLAIGVATLCGAFVSRAFLQLSFQKVRGLFSEKGGALDLDRAAQLRNTMWHNAKRLGVVQAMGFVLQRGSILIAATFLAPGDAASYALVINLLIAVMNFATLFLIVKSPVIARLQTTMDRQSIRKIFLQALMVALLILMSGYLVIGIAFPILLVSFNTEIQINLPVYILLLLFLFFTLETNHSLASIYITTKNQIPFVQSSIISGLASLSLGIVAAQHYGLVGIIMAQGLVQMSYNNWKWPAEAYRDLRTTKDKKSKF